MKKDHEPLRHREREDKDLGQAYLSLLSRKLTREKCENVEKGLEFLHTDKKSRDLWTFRDGQGDSLIPTE